MPSTKRSSFPSEGSATFENPNIPSCCEDHLKEEAFSKSLPGQSDALMNIGATRPVNLQIGPDSCTEVAREEQVFAIVICILVAQNTKVICIPSPPVPPHQQVLGVESFKE